MKLRSLLLLEVELMETYPRGHYQHHFHQVASIIRSGINGNTFSGHCGNSFSWSLLLLEVELMETYTLVYGC